uniref:NADH-ubiquinone oxidoreductase chain 5 n=1 Tax=Petalocephala chlorophana TaxID=2501810 RepID=A0A7L8XEM5_9HEMI|nr:NADH dehydrogenase subunit 5 [Petalocephala chlorophana]QOH91206.1 NADH dehydrogenase subunit 5 [Petalocephala chlorophana]
MMKLNMFNCWSTLFLISAMTSIVYSLNLLLMMNTTLLEFELIKLNSTEMYFIVLMDWMSMMFMSTVFTISSMIMLFSSTYMKSNKNEEKRFICLINLFILSMMLMIISPNMISIMLGWDGLGLTSYCLVIFFSSKKSYNSGMITCLTNRIGDIGLLISISWMMSYGSWHFMFYKEMYKEMICYLVLISCSTKSAQMPFYSWLPEAMSAPTPISALVHSSTLVTAGVYLTIRFINKMNTTYLSLLSMLTMMMSSICANYEFDLKKIIALSTLSQLSLMMTSTFLGMKELSFMHLLTHAMFKSLLFMSAGIMIFYNNNNQDIRNLGMMNKTLPMTYSCFSISTMALCGMPFLTGFYSKDTIVENLSMNKINMMTYTLMYLSLGLTMSYSTRTMYFISTIPKQKMIMKNFKMTKMKNSMMLLTISSICFGSMLMWITNLDLKIITLTSLMKVNPLIMIFTGMWMGFESFKMKTYLYTNKFYDFNSKMWNILKMMSNTQKNTFYFSLMLKNKLNSGWGEFYGAMGLSKTMSMTSKKLLMTKSNMIFLSILTWMITMM